MNEVRPPTARQWEFQFYAHALLLADVPVLVFLSVMGSRDQDADEEGGSYAAAVQGTQTRSGDSYSSSVYLYVRVNDGVSFIKKDQAKGRLLAS